MKKEIAGIDNIIHRINIAVVVAVVVIVIAIVSCHRIIVTSIRRH